jgi:glutathione peroxidase
MNDFFGFEVNALDGTPGLLGSLRGRVCLAVNVASRCGLTPQYTGLESLYREFAGRGLTVVGFPCNQFGAQEPGDAAAIRAFCSTSYGVTFPLAAKLEVNGAGRHPLYGWLTNPMNGHPGDIGWNFEKFLIARDGRLLQRFGPEIRPEDPDLRAAIVSAL